MNLHAKIMNIEAHPGEYSRIWGFQIAYRNGHKHARHAAAEIALKADRLLADISKAEGMSQVRRLLIQHGYYE